MKLYFQNKSDSINLENKQKNHSLRFANSLHTACSPHV